MAFSKAMQWDVRPATGSDNNGGGFKAGASGVDYSQQASPQYALTGVTSSGSGDTVLTASAATDMVGNVGQLISGTNFNAGIYEILSVVAGVSITFGQSRTGSSICSGTGASGVLNIGGSFASIAILAVGSNADVYNDNFVWVKGTVVSTSQIQPSSHMRFAGYGTVHGDNTRAAVTTATNSTKLFAWGNVYQFRFDNFDFSNTASSRDVGFNLNNNWASDFNNCSFDGFTYAVFGGFPFVAADTQESIHFLNCEIKNCNSPHATIQLYDPRGATFIGCWIHDNTGDGVGFGGSDQPGLVWFQNCALTNNTGIGVNISNQATGGQQSRSWGFNNCVFYQNGSDGLFMASVTYQSFINVQNCIFYLNGGFGINRGSTNDYFDMMYGASNAFGANVSGARGGIWPVLPGDVTLTADPFTNASGNDYTLNNTSGGGAACKSAGFESTVI